ncbi:MAG: phosphate transport system substrate-binding protein, partial [Solirubrobacteraceae bacterium]|nr:phosphate transport system substrate-binding protein [Solirubrobacteraceae bacterium]
MKLQRTVVALAGCSALALGVAACGSSNKSDNSASSGSGTTAATAQKGGTINGAGATFPQPVYSEWAARFKDAQGTTVNYQGIGSGGGIAQFTAGTVDFGATDSAMKDDEIAAAKKKGDPVHIPTVLGAVTVSYNVQGVDKGLKLDGATVADLFLGKIKTWDDAAIKKLN